MNIKVKYKKNVSCCGECPYYSEFHDMNATISCCEIYTKSEWGMLPDITIWNANFKISDGCPQK